jgi:formylglycine-generating enzyme required for sulfatase activity
MKNLFLILVSVLLLSIRLPGAWNNVVRWQDESGWQWVDLHWVHDSGDWKWLQDAQVWVYVFDPSTVEPPPELEGFAYVKAGSFMMGASDWEIGSELWYEKPQHAVTLTRNFFMQETEVTNAQFANVMNRAITNFSITVNSMGIYINTGAKEKLMDLTAENIGIQFDGYTFSVKQGMADYPCVGVTWYGAMAYCKFLSDIEGLNPAVIVSNWSINRSANGYRLPTEAEWEYACRAGTVTSYFNGDMAAEFPSDLNLDSVGWYVANSDKIPHAVGQKPANPWGLFDMHGNANEWCYDWYAQYTGASVQDPVGALTGTNKVVRGGHYDSYPYVCKSSWRTGWSPDLGNYVSGFRPVRTVP